MTTFDGDDSFLINTKTISYGGVGGEKEPMISMTRLGNILDFGQIIKAFGNN